MKLWRAVVFSLAAMLLATGLWVVGGNGSLAFSRELTSPYGQNARGALPLSFSAK